MTKPECLGKYDRNQFKCRTCRYDFDCIVVKNAPKFSIDIAPEREVVEKK